MTLVRPAQPADLPPLAVRLCDLPLLKAYGHYPDTLVASLKLAMRRGEGVWVYDDGRPVGLAWFLTRGTFAAGGYLRLLAVTAPAQGHGVGAALLDVFESATFAHSPHAFLLVSESNTGAQSFYRAHGYAPVGGLPGFVLPGETELIYWKARPQPR